MTVKRWRETCWLPPMQDALRKIVPVIRTGPKVWRCRKGRIRQTQSLVMTPQLMQAIKLLQLSNLDLNAYVEAELERNPVLSDRWRSWAAEVVGRRKTWPTRPMAIGCARTRHLASAIEEGLGTDLDNVFREPHRAPEAPAAIEQLSGSDPYVSSWSNVVLAGMAARTTSTMRGWQPRPHADHLEAQLALAIEDPWQRMIGYFIIDMIDETAISSAASRKSRFARRPGGGSRSGAGDRADSSLASRRGRCRSASRSSLPKRTAHPPFACSITRSRGQAQHSGPQASVRCR